MGCTLVIDTSYGSTVGLVGHEPIVETDSRTHVERLQINIAKALDKASMSPSDIESIVVGVGPAPFTGLRVGIVAAKAIAFATGARLIGRNVLDPQHDMLRIAMDDADTRFDGIGFLANVPKINPQSDAAERHVTLCVNDARRKQLYFALDHGGADGDADGRRWIDMDIDYPERLVERVNAVVREHAEADGVRYTVDVAGHGVAKYAQAWHGLNDLGCVVDGSVLDAGAAGLALFASTALTASTAARQASGTAAGVGAAVEPLYLRRPDAEIPAPLRHVLGHAGAERRQ